MSERVEALARQRGELDASLWAPEVEAQAHERTITRLWDDLRLADDRVPVLKAFPFDTLLLGSLGEVEKYDGDVYRTPCVGEPRRLSPEEWKQLLDRFQGHGFELLQSEWHHREFQPAVAKEGKPARSVFDIALHVRRREPRRFVIVRGDLRIEWSSRKDPDGRFIPREIDASRLELVDRRGDAPFRRRARMPDTANEARALGSTRAHPLIVYDLDGDGLSEIVLAGWNRLYRNLGGGRFERQDLCAFPRRIAPAGIIADFTGDGRPDFVCVGRDTHLYLYPGDGEGKFTARSRQCWPQGLQNPTVLSAGDCDGDGDLDLWLAQYRSAYTAGQMPTPIYDANDGYPSYLLRNDGAGNFTDVTEEAGLGKKRYRRTYSASLVDLDDDGDLDLLNVSDFSGIDLYLNDGAGRFRDVTDDLVDERHNAGMAHTFADFDLDGRLDFFVVGMSSATVRRIDGLDLGRPEFPDLSRMRGVLTRGNRLYLRRGERYEEPPFSDEAARTGWSWGTSSFDFDNDGDLDLYVANGNISARSARDYCTEFWRHDVYLGNSEPDAALEQHFSAALAPLIRGEMSWNGFEHNALLMNRGGKGFLDVAFLLGVALEVDGRGVVTDDLDGDGRVDLVTSEETTVGLRPAGQVVHVYQNRLTNDHHWVGVRLREEGGGFSPVGARVSLKTAAGRRVARIVTGDSLRSQHANTVHFGLGATGSVEWLEVRWLNGTVRRIERPEVDRYHDVRGRTGTRERPAPGER